MNDLDWLAHHIDSIPEWATYVYVNYELGDKSVGIGNRTPNHGAFTRDQLLSHREKLGLDIKPWFGLEYGPPPVGTNVTYPSGSGIVKLPVDSDGFLIIEENCNYKRVHFTHCRSVEEDKAVEEILKVMGDCATYDGAVALYRAGYRKQ